MLLRAQGELSTALDVLDHAQGWLVLAGSTSGAVAVFFLCAAAVQRWVLACVLSSAHRSRTGAAQELHCWGLSSHAISAWLPQPLHVSVGSDRSPRRAAALQAVDGRIVTGSALARSHARVLLSFCAQAPTERCAPSASPGPSRAAAAGPHVRCQSALWLR